MSSVNKEYMSHAALIFATETEKTAILRMYEWKEILYEDDRQLYYETEITRDGKQLRVVASQCSEYGMTAAATLSMKLIYRYRPHYIIMPGIAAGISENVQTHESSGEVFGDVVLATSVWNCANGKYTDPKIAPVKFGDLGFIPRPTVVKFPSRLIPVLQEIADCEEHECYVHLGPLASGSTVFASDIAVENLVSMQMAETKGLDMEAYGVAFAAREATEPRPIPIIAKSVCDFADSSKDDDYQEYAAFTSCEMTRYMIQNILPLEL